MSTYIDVPVVGGGPVAVPVSDRAGRLNAARLGCFILSLIAFIGPLRPRPDPDTWWHLATGKLILSTGRIPSADPFSWTAQGRPWVAHEWLSEVIFALTDRLAGPIGLLVLSGLLIGIAFLQLRRALGRITHNDWVILACLGPALYLSTITWSIRPHLFSVLLFTIFLDILLACRFSGHRRIIWLLIPLTVLWANLHGGFVSGLLLIWVFAIVAAIERRAEAKPLLLVAALCFLAGAATPNGFGIYPHVIHIARVSSLVIQEWRPPGLRNTHSTVFTLVMISTPVIIALVRPRDWALLATVFVFGLLGAGAVKNVWLAGITAAPALAWAASRWEGMPLPRVASRSERRVLGVVMATILISGISLGAIGLSRLSDTALRGESPFPRGAAEALDARPSGTMVNPYVWGGYLIWKAPRFPVSIDGRNDMYPERTLDDTATLAYLEPGWKKYLDDNSVRYVLWTRKGALTQALKLLPEWHVIFKDRDAILFERTKSV